ncbi:hypothetical protein U9M48_000816 [Paspalum notatum var. saurae]|uniref:Uncharacterized protein n=1 Tax=Paspalum notatum var. saurae TaxID=547442 RepID=A0AAQ3PF80_PASNO
MRRRIHRSMRRRVSRLSLALPSTAAPDLLRGWCPRSLHHAISSPNRFPLDFPLKIVAATGPTQISALRMEHPWHFCNGRIAIIPEGDNQFRYANYSVDDKMKKGPILGVILKQEYPPLIEGTSRTGQRFQYHASKWEHYYHIVRDDGQTQADRVKEEFWSIYSVPVELEDEADQTFEKYGHTQVKNMMYQARLDAVKHFYREIIGSPKSDTFARSKSLGQASKKKNPDGAQNRGGSRPLVETQQYIAAKFGPEKATVINTYCCMKCGVKNCDSSGRAGPIPSERAKQLVDDYNTALQEKYPDDWQEQPFDGKIAYDIGGGLPHGRLAIGAGAVKKAAIIDAAKESAMRPSTSRAYQNLLRRYEEQVANNQCLTEENAALTQQNVSLSQHMKRSDRVLELICHKVQIEIPPDLLEEEVVMRGNIDGSSHASANLVTNSDGPNRYYEIGTNALRLTYG